jgi:hypothetical protein
MFSVLNLWPILLTRKDQKRSDLEEIAGLEVYHLSLKDKLVSLGIGKDSLVRHSQKSEKDVGLVSQQLVFII